MTVESQLREEVESLNNEAERYRAFLSSIIQEIQTVAKETKDTFGNRDVETLSPYQVAYSAGAYETAKDFEYLANQYEWAFHHER